MYRPICLISAIGKLYQNIINKRLIKAIDSKGGMSDRQYGFRAGRSKIDAVEEVISIAKGGNRTSRPKWCALILVDVKNAFNSANWEIILKKLEAKGIPRHIYNIICDYFTDRSGPGSRAPNMRGGPAGEHYV